MSLSDTGDDTHSSSTEGKAPSKIIGFRIQPSVAHKLFDEKSPISLSTTATGLGASSSAKGLSTEPLIMYASLQSLRPL